MKKTVVDFFEKKVADSFLKGKKKEIGKNLKKMKIPGKKSWEKNLKSW